MNLEETKKYITELKNSSEKKYDKMIYDKFIAILFNLENRDLTEKQLMLIETRLDTLSLDLKNGNKKKYLGSKLEGFKKFLKDNLSLISEGHYTGYGMSFGMLAGILVQFYFGLFSMVIGMCVGLIIGGFLDSEAKKEGRVLNTKLPD